MYFRSFLIVCSLRPMVPFSNIYILFLFFFIFWPCTICIVSCDHIYKYYSSYKQRRGFKSCVQSGPLFSLVGIAVVLQDAVLSPWNVMSGSGFAIVLPPPTTYTAKQKSVAHSTMENNGRSRWLLSHKFSLLACGLKPFNLRRRTHTQEYKGVRFEKAVGLA